MRGKRGRIRDSRYASRPAGHGYGSPVSSGVRTVGAGLETCVVWV